MSWSIAFIGEPKNVAHALTAQAEKLDGLSKQEYETALPNLLALVNQNFGNEGQVVKVTAAGHGYSENGKMKYSSCSASLETVYGFVAGPVPVADTKEVADASPASAE